MSNVIRKKTKTELRLSPIIILIRPQMGANIGSVARAMLNFNCTELRIVSPRDGWPNQHAIAVSSGAGSILDNAKIFDSTLEACLDINYLFATTARDRGLTNNIFSPNQAMEKIIEIIKTDGKIGILFGPERSGLENDDIALSRSIISVPVSKKFPSLNLAQCVVIILYEWFKLSDNQKTIARFKRNTTMANIDSIDHLKLALTERLERANYFWPVNKKKSLLENIGNLLGRLPLTDADVKTFHGIIRALGKKVSEK
jgi:tRNA/rRNA methyltransferase